MRNLQTRAARPENLCPQAGELPTLLPCAQPHAINTQAFSFLKLPFRAVSFLQETLLHPDQWPDEDPLCPQTPPEPHTNRGYSHECRKAPHNPQGFIGSSVRSPAQAKHSYDKSLPPVQQFFMDGKHFASRPFSRPARIVRSNRPGFHKTCHVRERQAGKSNQPCTGTCHHRCGQHQWYHRQLSRSQQPAQQRQ